MKNKDILVIVGNPPYNINSQNNNDFISKLIEDYKYFNEIKIKGSHGLNNDYVKFIRYAEHKMNKVEQGLVALITNNSFLTSPTFCGMRQSLSKTFNRIMIVDLGGNSRISRKITKLNKDENIFDIRQGVCIIFLIKNKDRNNSILFNSMYGKKNIKLNNLNKYSLYDLNYKDIVLDQQFNIFQPSLSYHTSYFSWISIRDIFSQSGRGIVTQRDRIAIDYTKNALLDKVLTLKELTSENARVQMAIGKDSKKWKLSYIKNCLKDFNEKNIKNLSYRPFDNRFVYYTGNSKGLVAEPSIATMQHMLAGDNVGLVSVRQSAEDKFNHVFVSSDIVELHGLSIIDNNYLYPLYLYQDNQKTENITPETREIINAKYNPKGG